jgi:hypothetical protein
MTLRNIIDFFFFFSASLVCDLPLVSAFCIYLDDFVGLAEREADTK